MWANRFCGPVFRPFSGFWQAACSGQHDSEFRCSVKWKKKLLTSRQSWISHLLSNAFSLTCTCPKALSPFRKPLKNITSTLTLRTVPPFVTAHTFCAPRDGPRKSGFVMGHYHGDLSVFLYLVKHLTNYLFSNMKFSLRAPKRKC